MREIVSKCSRKLEAICFTAGFFTFTPLENNSNSPMLTSYYQSGDLSGLINALFLIAISVGAILAVLRLAYAGFIYMGAADMWGEKNVAKDMIQNAVIGLLMLLATVTVLQFINPDIVSLNVLRNLTQTNANTAPAQTTSPFGN
jgi:hypothetical protein